MSGQDGTQLLPHVTAKVLPGSADAFEALRWAVSPMFDCDAPDREARKLYAADIESYDFGAMRLGATQAPATNFVRTSSVIARSGTDHLVLQLYKSSDYNLAANGDDVTVKAGDVALIDLTRPAQIRAAGVSNISLVIPRALVEPWVADINRAHGLVLREGTQFNTLLRAHLLMVEKDAGRLTFADADAISQATMVLVGACIGISPDGQQTAKAGLRQSLLHMICREIEVHLGDPGLGPEFLTRRFAVSRAVLYRLFEPLGGVMRYIQQRRLAGAFRDLTRGECFHERIDAIARKWGITDHTSFGRAFRIAYGMTPRDIREAARAGRDRSDIRPRGRDDAFNMIKQWVAAA